MILSFEYALSCGGKKTNFLAFFDSKKLTEEEAKALTCAGAEGESEYLFTIEKKRFDKVLSPLVKEIVEEKLRNAQ